VLQNRWHPSRLVHVRQHSPPASTPHAGEHVDGEVLLSNSAQLTRGVFCFIGSLLAAAWGASLVSSAPAWGNARRPGEAGPVAPSRIEVGLSRRFADAVARDRAASKFGRRSIFSVSK
jgi:hypothetical protein